MAHSGFYETIIKYRVNAVCLSPLHIGNAEGDGTEVLIHPADQRPFIQASSIAGVLRDYYSRYFDPDRTEQLFGGRKSDEFSTLSDYSGRIRISDGIFTSAAEIETRPRVAINRDWGSSSSSRVKGSERKSGHKFEMECIGAGAEFSFDIYLYDASFESDLEKVLSALNASALQFGGQKSNGCGYIRIESLLKMRFSMKDRSDAVHDAGNGSFYDWLNESELPDTRYASILNKLERNEDGIAYRITLHGRTEEGILIKSIYVKDETKDAPDADNIRNAKGEYIIPGSSIKGALRSQMEKIAAYRGQEKLIDTCFGSVKNDENAGNPGLLRFADAVIGDREANEYAAVQRRIHIDKLTGGVMHSALFSEKSAFGDIDLQIQVRDGDGATAAAGLTLLALRDLSAGMINLGSGYSIGKGFIKQPVIEVCRVSDGAKAKIILETKDAGGQGSITDPGEIVAECLKGIRG